jgi:hypothetical protein
MAVRLTSISARSTRKVRVSPDCVNKRACMGLSEPHDQKDHAGEKRREGSERT